MREDFCVFILTHGRANRVYTLDTLLSAGYTGKWYIVIDDEDSHEEEYRKRFGSSVIQFSKKDIDSRIDPCDNFQDRRTILHARNACFDLADMVGCKYFMQLDDDYKAFELRYQSDLSGCYVKVRKTLDQILDCLIEFYISIPALSIAMSQGGDFIGGTYGTKAYPKLLRKAMNTFICSTDRRFLFRSTFNEDVGTYVTLSRAGSLFFTVMQAKIVQLQTQSNAGGITDLYKAFGTYTKSFTTVMQQPSCVKIGTLGDPRSPHYRIHHEINWNRTAPKILREEIRK